MAINNDIIFKLPVYVLGRHRTLIVINIKGRIRLHFPMEILFWEELRFLERRAMYQGQYSLSPYLLERIGPNCISQGDCGWSLPLNKLVKLPHKVYCVLIDKLRKSCGSCLWRVNVCLGANWLPALLKFIN